MHTDPRNSFVPLDGRPWLALGFGLAPLLILGAAIETVRYARQERADA